MDFLVEENVLVRTVTMIFTGVLNSFDDKFLYLSKAAWIPDTGRWHVAVRDAEFAEVEMYPKDRIVAVAIGALVDICEIPKLPTETK